MKVPTLVLSLVMCIPAFAASNKISPDLNNKDPDDVVNVIIQYWRPPSAKQKQRILAHGGSFNGDLPLVNGISGRMPAHAFQALAEDPDIRYISPDRPIGAHLNYVAAAVNAAYAWSSSLDGSGISVAVIDSGIGNVEDLKNSAGALRVVYSQDFVGGGTDDQYGHGTHIAGSSAELADCRRVRTAR